MIPSATHFGARNPNVASHSANDAKHTTGPSYREVAKQANANVKGSTPNARKTPLSRLTIQNIGMGQKDMSAASKQKVIDRVRQTLHGIVMNRQKVYAERHKEQVEMSCKSTGRHAKHGFNVRC
ncbi:hypothetical protein EC912_104153 [Luteibacter rhizovicinus]|uniref:Uncharacterized protein n=1 Tax=Luteibacter rhizovicinus TaxID=242606 RepID=A0A4R3YMU6_9GAMM|nr:hypothetical protein [Luteibacter rhizovicinus]TCV93957.1 hypothetical protein EC912_104153 [Luteibacter rhizovicinus]